MNLILYGHTDAVSGTSRHALSFSHAYEKRRAGRLGWRPVDGHSAHTLLPQWLDNSYSTDSTASSTTALGIGAPDIMPKMVGTRRIAWVVWESTLMPPSRSRHLVNMDAVWTPTDWGRNVLTNSGLPKNKIQVVPEGVDADLFRPIPRASTQGDTFRFLSVGKWEPRKGFDLLLRAWATAFQPEDNVELVLHTYAQGPGRKDRLQEEVRRMNLGPHAPIVWSRPTSLLKLVMLYNACHCLVSATRGEGWGLPIFEALSCAKPVIVPRFGALDELLDEDLAFLVDCRDPVPARDGQVYGDDKDCGHWADPDIDHLIHQLRQAATDPDEARSRGARGRQAVLERWTWNHSVDAALKILDIPPVDSTNNRPS